jgi:hypothetical protein
MIEDFKYIVQFNESINNERLETKSVILSLYQTILYEWFESVSNKKNESTNVRIQVTEENVSYDETALGTEHNDD